MTETLGIREARARPAEILSNAEAGDFTVITRKGERVGAVVPIEVLDAVEEAADRLLAREASAYVDEPTVSMAELLADLFSDDQGAA
ncbi:type II toxin-antitoxin system prevent-host-death family antitoxin [Streptomyces fagopyri]|uniref:Antitoxin n=1 Tax=Streptomyces fagopyri TaxID=2662397 RepID=A0A5Q0LKB1_9ACTN|nr:type II toxin-antitoxin system prevent-host-death family antitoxin [Streptomyces fagopyri]QFZ76919.1 type II toxin-antitoxin system prevent-host-death family antitoxin [Streptomyces fagopyri]